MTKCRVQEFERRKQKAKGSDCGKEKLVKGEGIEVVGGTKFFVYWLCILFG